MVYTKRKHQTRNRERVSAFRRKNPPINDSDKPGIIDLDHINFGSTDVGYLWTAFTQGYHFNLYETPYEDPDEESPEWVNIRHNIGKAIEYSQKIDLANFLSIFGAS